MARNRQKRAAAKKKRRAARKQNAAKRTTSAPSGYHPDKPLEAAAWRAMAPEARLEQVEAFHRRLPAGKRPPSARRHAALHVLVEDQLAADDPPEVMQAVGRLIQDGMTRHDALHAVGLVATQTMQQALESGAAPDMAAYTTALKALDRAAFERLARG